MAKGEIRLTTNVSIPASPFIISHRDSIMMMGSCFVDNIGNKMTESGFRTMVNPFGVLFNPISIKKSIERIESCSPLTMNDVFYRDDAFNSFHFHSRFAKSDAEEYLSNVNNAITECNERFKEISVLFVTFGTSWIYKLESTGEVVSNCHKWPANTFVRERLSAEQIVSEYTPFISRLLQNKPGLNIVLTVSPIRHFKDGAHDNQLSKATLLLAADALVRSFPDNVYYFPAYEIMMDELRDYRFYADDLVHPSTLAVNYIWKKFSSVVFTEETMALNAEIQDINAELNHRPFNPDSVLYSVFMEGLKAHMSRLKKIYPYISFPQAKD